MALARHRRSARDHLDAPLFVTLAVGCSGARRMAGRATRGVRTLRTMRLRAIWRRPKEWGTVSWWVFARRLMASLIGSGRTILRRFAPRGHVALQGRAPRRVPPRGGRGPVLLPSLVGARTGPGFRNRQPQRAVIHARSAKFCRFREPGPRQGTTQSDSVRDRVGQLVGNGR